MQRDSYHRVRTNSLFETLGGVWREANSGVPNHLGFHLAPSCIESSKLRVCKGPKSNRSKLSMRTSGPSFKESLKNFEDRNDLRPSVGTGNFLVANVAALGAGLRSGNFAVPELASGSCGLRTATL